MDLFRKAFLFLVGAVAIAYEEAEKSIQEAARSIEERGEKMAKREKPAPKVTA